MQEFHVDSVAVALLLGRVVIGLLMAAHGAQKLFGWFGGYGLRGTGEFMVQLGFQQGRAFAAAAGTGEVVSGFLVALGLLGPVGPGIIISLMLVAAATVHWKNGIFAATNGIELNLVYAVGALVFAFSGYGAYSLDSATGFPNPWSHSATWTVLAIAVVAGLANVVLRRPPASKTAVHP